MMVRRDTDDPMTCEIFKTVLGLSLLVLSLFYGLVVAFAFAVAQAEKDSLGSGLSAMDRDDFVVVTGATLVYGMLVAFEFLPDLLNLL